MMMVTVKVGVASAAAIAAAAVAAASKHVGSNFDIVGYLFTQQF